MSDDRILEEVRRANKTLDNLFTAAVGLVVSSWAIIIAIIID